MWQTTRIGLGFSVGAWLTVCACAPSASFLDAAVLPDVDDENGEDAGNGVGMDAALPARDAANPPPPADAGPMDQGDAGNGAWLDAGHMTVDAHNSVPDAGGAIDTCQDDDPLTRGDWVGFCGDRVDDNCRVDAPNDPCPSSPSSHNYCRTADEPCPATQPASAPPAWDCTGTPPSDVIAYAYYNDNNNQNVTRFCAFVYESSAFPGEHYVAVDVTNGSNVRAAQPGVPGRDCQADTFARRHFYLSNLDDGDCPDVKYIHAYANPTTGYLGYPVDEQKLSNSCRKMIRNIGYNDPAFSPDIQYFAASREEASAKLAVLERAEVNCIGIDNLQNQPYRTTEQFYVQASAPVVMVQP